MRFHYLGLWLVLQAGLSFADTALDRAKKATEAQQWPLAEAELQLWLKQHPRDLDALFLKARILSWQGRYRQSVKLYQSLIAKEAHNIDYLSGLAHVYYWQKHPRLALKVLDKALKIEPDNQNLVQLKVSCLYAAHEYKQATKLQQQAAKQFPPQLTAGAKESFQAKAEDQGKNNNQIMLPAPESLERAANTIIMAGNIEHLDNRFANWHSSYLAGSHAFNDNFLIYGRLLEAGRFDLEDFAYQMGLTKTINKLWTLNLEFEQSPTQQFLPTWTLYGSATYQLFSHVNAVVGFRHAEYREQTNDMGNVGAESYFGNWRLAYTLFISQLQLAEEPTYSHMGQLSYYYDDRSSIGISVGNGQQAIYVGPGQLLNSDTQTYAITGKHWLNKHLAMVYEISSNIQGDSYTRTGATFGLCYAF